MLLGGKTAVITGCVQGIGRSALDLFVENGANVFACDRAPTDEFAAHCQALAGKFAVNVIPVYFDLADNAAIKRAAFDIQQRGVPVDALINIAGINRDALFQMMTLDQLQLTLQVNVVGQLLLTQYISRLMQRRRRGSIVNIASITGIDGNPGQVAYSASKGAMIAATKTLASELGPQGIRVNAVAPGVIATSMTSAVSPSVIDRLVGRARLKRLGHPSEVAGVCAYLASDLSSFITGQVIRVDGGIG